MSSALDVKKNVTLDPTKLNSLVNLFHSWVPKRYHEWLDSKKCLCCRKTDRYKLFEDGNDLYEHEIDIVRLLQYFRFMRHFIRNMMK